MVISGSRLRQLYPQSGISWQAVLNPLYTSGSLEFSFSGSNGLSNAFKLKNGKILSPDSSIVGSYISNQNLTLSGNISNYKLDLYTNNKPLFLGLNRQVTGLVSGIVLNNLNNSSIDLFIKFNINW